MKMALMKISTSNNPNNTHTEQVTSPVSLSYGQTADRQAPTYSAQSASQECIKTVPWAEMSKGWNACRGSRSAQQSFILWQTVAIRPVERRGEISLITRQNLSNVTNIKNSGGHLRSSSLTSFNSKSGNRFAKVDYFCIPNFPLLKKEYISMTL